MWRRGIHAAHTFTLADRKRPIVTDELQARHRAELWWYLHTEPKGNWAKAAGSTC